MIQRLRLIKQRVWQTDYKCLRWQVSVAFAAVTASYC